MALGTFTLVEQAASVGPITHIRCTVVGPASYTTGGVAGLLALVRAALGGATMNIMSVQSEGDNGDHLVSYDHANEKLFLRVASTGAEVANAADKSATTFGLHIVCY